MESVGVILSVCNKKESLLLMCVYSKFPLTVLTIDPGKAVLYSLGRWDALAVVSMASSCM